MPIIALKIAFNIFFYLYIVYNFNIGDTDDYIDAIHIDRMDFTSFAFLMSFTAYYLQEFIVLLDVLFFIFVYKKLGEIKYKYLILLVLFFNPQFALFVTVYSKEMVVAILLLIAIFSKSKLVFYLSLAFLLMHKAPFIVVPIIVKVLQKVKIKALEFCIFSLIAISGFMISILVIKEPIVSFYTDSLLHFSMGATSYPIHLKELTPLEITGTILLRSLMLDFSSKAIIMSLLFYLTIITSFVLIRLTNKKQLYSYAVLLLISVLAIFPYSIFNPGSFLRYCSPILFVLLIYALVHQSVESKQKEIDNLITN